MSIRVIATILFNTPKLNMNIPCGKIKAFDIRRITLVPNYHVSYKILFLQLHQRRVLLNVISPSHLQK